MNGLANPWLMQRPRYMEGFFSTIAARVLFSQKQGIPVGI